MVLFDILSLAEGQLSEKNYRVFAVDRIGVALYFYAVVYGVFFILSLFRLRAVTRFISLWSAQKLLYTSIVVHLFVRTASFGLLALFTLGNAGKLWYPFQAMLFTFPEYCIVSIYILIFLTWAESVIFSHSQFLVTSRSKFRKYTRIVFFIFCSIMYILVCILYLLLCSDANSFQDFVGSLIEWSCAILNSVIVLLAVIVALYIKYVFLSGFQLQSPISKELVRKVYIALVIWTIGRLFRASVFYVSLSYRWQQHMASNTLSMLITTILVITEFAPILYILDYTLICVLLIGEEVAEAHTVDNSTALLSSSGSPSDYDDLESSSSSSFSERSFQLLDMAQIKLPREMYHRTASASLSTIVSPTSIATTTGPQVLYDSGLWCTATGVVENGLLGTDIPTQGLQKVLVKRYRLEGLSTSSVQELAYEVFERSKIKGNIAQMHGISISNNMVFLISKFYSRRALFDLLTQATRDISPSAVLKLSYQVASSMESLHSKGFVHAHLKSSNVLLDNEWNAIVCDHGVRYIKTYAEVMYGCRFHTGWTAPEVLNGLQPSKSSDVYSFGVLCWEMMYRTIPFAEYNPDQLVAKVGKAGERLALPSQIDLKTAHDNAVREGKAASVIPPPYVSLIARCFLAADLRPSFSDILLTLSRISKEMGYPLN